MKPRVLFFLSSAILGMAPRFAGAADCNGNAIADDVEIARDAGLDCDANGIPDACDLFPAFTFTRTGRFLTDEPAPGVLVPLDADGDGNLDIAVAHGEDSSLSLLLGDGQGSFPRSLPPVPAPRSRALAAADLDGDGDPDLAAAAPFTVLVLLGARGDFAVARRLIVGSDPAAVASADLDGDGDVDLATANALAGNALSDNVSVLLNEGAAAFAGAANYEAGHGPRGLLAHDLDGDGDVDLATTHDGLGAQPHIAFLRNRGNASFAVVEEILSGFHTALTAGDLDGDAKTDLAAATILASEPTQVIHVLRGAEGRFLPRRVFITPPLISLQPVDLDGDGLLDLSIATGAGILTLANAGDLHFTEMDLAGPGRFLVAAAAADFTGDGRTDFCLSRHGPRGVEVFVNTPGAVSALRSFTWTEAHYPATRNTRGLAAGDLDGDGDVDLAAGGLVILRNRGDGSSFTTSAHDEAPGPVALADFDGDGDLDAASGNGMGNGRGDILLFSNSGGVLSLEAGVAAMGSGHIALAARDLDGDGDADLAALPPTHLLAILRGDGQGAFGAPETYSVGGTGQHLRALMVADLDGDADPDLAATLFSNSLPVSLPVLINDGRGGFASSLRGPALARAHHASAADLDLDGDQDLLVTAGSGETTDPGEVIVLANNGGGVFSERSRSPAGLDPRWGVPVDLDGDGDADYATAGTWASTLTLFTNQAGVLSREASHHVGAVLHNGPEWILAEDLNGDGQLELATLDSEAGLVSVFFRRSRHSARDRDRDGLLDACETRSFHRGDADGRGSLDLTDAIFILGFLFQGGEAPACREAADADNDGVIRLTDGVLVLAHLFLGMPGIAPPGPPGFPCGEDPDPEGSPLDLGCGAYAACAAR
jgi:hypothetical protein